MKKLMASSGAYRICSYVELKFSLVAPVDPEVTVKQCKMGACTRKSTRLLGCKPALQDKVKKDYGGHPPFKWQRVQW